MCVGYRVCGKGRVEGGEGRERMGLWWWTCPHVEVCMCVSSIKLPRCARDDTHGEAPQHG